MLDHCVNIAAASRRGTVLCVVPVLSADPSATVSPSTAVTTVGQSITFTCNVSGHPLPNIAYWTLANDHCSRCSSSSTSSSCGCCNSMTL